MQNVEARKAYRRAAQTKVRLEQAIKSGLPAAKVAHINAIYERQRAEYVMLKTQALKL